MGLKEMMVKEGVLLNQSIDSKEKLLLKIAELAVKNPVLKDISEKEIYDFLKDREAITSTAIAPEIAIPHCRIEGLTDFVLGVITVPNGLDFAAVDKNVTKIFVYLIAPLEKRKESVKLLAGISQLLNNKRNRRKILSLTDKKELIGFFEKNVLIDESAPVEKSFNEFRVVINSEEKFTDIVQIFTEMNCESVIILEAQKAEQFLYHMPLFHSFMTNQENNFCRVICAVVSDSIIDQLKNSIDKISDDSEEVIYYSLTIENLKK